MESAYEELVFYEDVDEYEEETELNTKEVEEREITFHVIPKGATGRIQPLDVYFNRQYKDLMRQLCHLIQRRQPDYTISVRKNLARLLSIVHRQFTAPRF